MNKLLKLMSVAWFVNFVLFTTSLFLLHYCDSIGHWSAGAWVAVNFTLGLTKLVLTISVIVNITKNGIDGDKNKH